MFRTLLLAATAMAASTLAPTAASAVTYVYVGSYWVGSGVLWSTNFPQTAYSPQMAAALLFGGNPGKYAISTQSTVVDHLGWVDGYGTSVHLKKDWDTGGFGTPVAENFQPYPTYDAFGAFSAYVGDREQIFGTPLGGANYQYASINYVFTAVPEAATWAMLITGFGLVGTTLRRRNTATA